MNLPDLSNVMPFHVALTLFLMFFMSTLGIYAARALAHCCRILYHAAEAAFAPDDVPAQDFDPTCRQKGESRMMSCGTLMVPDPDRPVRGKYVFLDGERW